MLASTSRLPPAPLPGLGALLVELAEMILNTTGADGEPILSGSDICSLRLIDRMLQVTSFETFAKRLFNIRKHMLDQRSLNTLLSIARHPVLGTYVRGVAVGPECINALFVENDGHARPDDDLGCSHGLIDSHHDPSTVAHFRELVVGQDLFGADCEPGSECAIILGRL